MTQQRNPVPARTTTARLMVGLLLLTAALVALPSASAGETTYCDQSPVNYAVGLVIEHADQCGPCRDNETNRIFVQAGSQTIYYPYCQNSMFFPQELPPEPPASPDQEQDG